MNTPKPRSGYPHRAELNTKFHPAQSGIPDSTEFTVYCQDCADARLSIHAKHQESFDAWKQEQEPAPKFT